MSLGNEGERLLPDDPQLLVQLMESTDDSLWMFTADWDDLVFVNSAYEDIFCQSISALTEDPTAFLEAVHPADRDKAVDRMEQLVRGEPADLEFRVDTDGASQKWVWVKGEPILDESGDVAYIAGYSRDITTRKKYQQQLEKHKRELERSNESLREFAYIASHDLQEPLRMVSSYVDLLETEYGDQLDDEAAEYMEFAVNGARRMKRMINSLLEYSRVHTEGGKFEPVDLEAVFDATRKDLELLLDEYDAEVTVAELPTIHADRDQIGQIFQNLVKNAVEHAGEDGMPKVAVSATERETEHLFTVSDNGPGIPDKQQEEIFKIFNHGSAPSNAGNTGIGLAITQRIVQRHGGEIWVDSEANGGAEFKFTIPKPSYLPEKEEVPT